MPHLVKVQEQYKSQGLIIIGSHCQQVEQAKVCGLCRSKNVNYTVVNAGRLQGDDSNGIPHAWLFDASGKLVQEGHVEEMAAKIDELLKSAPHWITRGKKLESPAKAVAEGLKAGKPMGWALGETEALLKKGDAKVADEAQFLKDQLTAEGDKAVAEATALEAENAFKAEQAFEAIKGSWKKTDFATKADARLKELKKDKDFQEEVKAGKMCAQIDELCAQLIPVNGAYNLEYAGNRATAQNIAGLVKALKAKHASSAVAKKTIAGLKAFGFPE